MSAADVIATWWRILLRVLGEGNQEAGTIEIVDIGKDTKTAIAFPQ